VRLLPDRFTCDIATYPTEGGRTVQWMSKNEQAVYSNRWFSVNLADVELPDGRRLDHFLIRLRPVAVATVVNEANEVLLLWRHRFITDSYGWELAAGVVEDGEDIAVAAARELEEETGWRPGPLRHLMSVEPSNGLTDARHHIYWADEGEYVGHPVDDFESDRREWVPLKLVPDLVVRGEVPAANMAAALFLLHHLRLGQDALS
jgi:8-oxo-dGTP pyrophosphatase MutT (NUDIX family)